MIKNEHQLSVAQKKLAEVRAEARAADARDREILLAFAEELAGDIREFDSVRSGHARAFKLMGLDDLPDALVKARIAQGLSQRDLAGRLDVAEQSVQRDEQGGYERATLARMADVVDALDYQLEGVLQPANESVASWDVKVTAGAFYAGPSTGVQSVSFQSGRMFGSERARIDTTSHSVT